MKKTTGKIIKDPSSLGQLGGAIEQICEEKGLEKEKVMESIEAALAAAYKKDYGKKGQIIVASLDAKTGNVSFKQLKEVVDETSRDPESIKAYKNSLLEEEEKKAEKEESRNWEEKKKANEFEEERLPRFNRDRDILWEEAQKIDPNLKVGDFLEIDLEPQEDYGRVASQTAKQVIIQRLREAERDAMYEEYKEREGEVISGIIQRVEGKNVFIDLGKSTGVLFPSNQFLGDRYEIGRRIKVYIEKVESDPQGPGVVLSRCHPNLLAKLFELEVPEIYTGLVQIRAIAREAGSRSKIAVYTEEKGVDPIGACVGQKGTRVQSVVDEIGGEKIDIIEWSDDVGKLIAAALSPAKVLRVELEPDNREAKVFVQKDQVSLAIGKKGQNVRLASKLVGWRLSVMGVEKEDSRLQAEAEEENFEEQSIEEGEKQVATKKKKKENLVEDEAVESTEEGAIQKEEN